MPLIFFWWLAQVWKYCVFRSPFWYQFCFALCFHLISSRSCIPSISCCSFVMAFASAGISRRWSSSNCLVFSFSCFFALPNFRQLYLDSSCWQDDNLRWTACIESFPNIIVPSCFYNPPALLISIPAILKLKSLFVWLLLGELITEHHMDGVMVKGSCCQNRYRNSLEMCAPLLIRKCAVQTFFCKSGILPSVTPCKSVSYIPQISKLAILQCCLESVHLAFPSNYGPLLLILIHNFIEISCAQPRDGSMRF